MSVLDEGGADAFVKYDIYNALRRAGEVAATMQKYLPRIGHVQLADNPDATSRARARSIIHSLFAHLDRICCDGWIDCEYKPAARTEAGIAWRAQILCGCH